MRYISREIIFKIYFKYYFKDNYNARERERDTMITHDLHIVHNLDTSKAAIVYMYIKNVINFFFKL